MAGPLNKLLKSLQRTIYRAEPSDAPAEVDVSKLWRGPDRPGQAWATSENGGVQDPVLPLVPAVVLAQAPETKPVPKTQAKAQVHALYVESNNQYALAIQTALEDFGMRVVRASDGVDLLERLSFWRGALPQLVILNVTMTRLDGYGTLDLLRRSPHSQGLRVVVLGPNQPLHPRSMERLEQADAYLARPGSALELRNNLRQLISGIPELHRN